MSKTSLNKKNYNEMGSVTIPVVDYLQMRIELSRLGNYVDRLAEIVKSLGKMSEEKRARK